MNHGVETAPAEIIKTNLMGDVDLDIPGSSGTDPNMSVTLPRHPSKGNSTVPKSQAQSDLDERIEALFEIAREESFEDGMKSDFSEELISLVIRYEDEALMALIPRIICRRVNAEVAAHALRWLAKMDHPQTYKLRLWMLEKSILAGSSPWIRDGAALGLASVRDPHAIFYLRQAISNENNEQIRESMRQILTDLESIT